MKHDISWKRFTLGCLALSSVIVFSESAQSMSRVWAKPTKSFQTAAGTDSDFPPAMTEKQLPANLKPEPPVIEQVKPNPYAGQKTAKLIVTVIDGRTQKPIEGVDVVVVETGDRANTDASGNTPALSEPVPREEKGRLLINRLHGQLGVIAYKNGYRDSITFGIRMHEGRVTRITVWMYKIMAEGGALRVEPVFYEVPYHRLYLLQLADAFRKSPQEGEGAESPDR